MPAKKNWVQAKEAIVVVVGARAQEWRKELVRNRHTGRLEAVSRCYSARRLTG